MKKQHKRSKTVMIMAGGTGGHVMPALAVAKELHDKNVNIVWMGTRLGIENNLVPKAGYPLKFVSVKGVRGASLLRIFLTPLMLLLAAFQACIHLVTCRVNLVLGMGGFASGPGGVMARLLFRPLIIHEQNAVAGTTNKLLAPLATRILTGFEQVFKQAKTVGNPVKSKISALSSPSKRLAHNHDDVRILIVGGSQGALIFNQCLPKQLDQIQVGKHISTPLSIWHQAGENRAVSLEQTYQEFGLDAKVDEFIADMAPAYHWCDLLICRAGAMTVAEVAAAGVAAIFIPYPHAIDDHQFYNAKAMADAGAALSFRQDAFENGAWLDDLIALVENKNKRIAMAQKARDFSRPDAAADVANVCLEVMNA